jgi:hypothetical protein
MKVQKECTPIINPISIRMKGRRRGVEGGRSRDPGDLRIQEGGL